MIILSIETSCDETAISIIEAAGDFPNATYAILGDAVFSQIEIHREYGGVFPAVAKREHILTLVPVLKKALTEANVPPIPHHALFPEEKEHLHALLVREPGLADALISFFEQYDTPAIDLIAVTKGPGLEPALWVGINFAKALSALWKVPVVGINHMEGHIFGSLFVDGERIAPISFPAVVLLISGGHTELVLMKDWGSYELLGKTRDDAVGEAFDKVARTLGLPYPGGPEISKRAHAHRVKKSVAGAQKGAETPLAFPRPMLNTPDCDFSFSGLKTAVLYHVKDNNLTEADREEISEAFENAVTEVLLKKTMRAVELNGAQAIILGGGVSANNHIRESFETLLEKQRPDLALFLPKKSLTGDNAIMIALAAHSRYSTGTIESEADMVANGNLSISVENTA